MIARLGGIVWQHYDELRHVAAVIGTALFFSVRPRSWNRGARDLLARQILAIGIDPVGSVCAIAAFVGISVVVQLVFWTRAAGQSELLGPLLVASVARELGPLLTNVVMIVRSSSTITTELGEIRLNLGNRAIQGADVFLDSVMPRVLAAAASTFCLSAVFITTAFGSGYLFGALLGTGPRNLGSFANAVFGALRPQDMIGVVLKTLLPALYTSASCCAAGLSAESATDLPRVRQRALNSSIIGLFILSAAMSIMTYL